MSRGNPAKAILVPFAKRLPQQRGYANERLGWVAKHEIADIDRGYKGAVIDSDKNHYFDTSSIGHPNLFW